MKHQDFTENCLSTRLAYDGHLLKVREDTVSLPDGGTAGREWIQHPGAVVIVAMLDESTLLIERQFRYPLKRHFYELPAGKMEPGEEPLETAKRELIEECGYQAHRWERLATLHPCIGYSDERIELYLAGDLTSVPHARDEGEFLEVMPVALRELVGWVTSGRITDTKTIIGVLWMDRLQREQTT